MSLWDIDEAPEERMLHRYMSMGERFRLQGLTPGLAQFLTPAHATVVSGNAFPPPLVAAVCLPLLRSIRESRIDIHKRLSETYIECLIPHKRCLKRRYP